MNAIDIFPWNDNFNTGIPEIDEQHQKLVRLLIRWLATSYLRSDLPSLNLVIDELADYAGYHFQTEEAIRIPTYRTTCWN